jgi:Predicted membrane protein
VTPYVLTFKDKFGVTLPEAIIIFLLPLLVFIICFVVWNKYGRDINLKRTIVPEFEIPEKLTPMEMGGILSKGCFGDKAMTATIIHLGVLGYLKIESNKSDFKLIRTDKLISPDLYAGEKLVLETIFKSKTEINLKDLGDGNYSLTLIPKVASLIDGDLKTREIIDASGKYSQIKMVVAGIMVIFLAIAFPVLVVSVIVSAIIIFIFAAMMGKLTRKGAELKLRIDGFKLYMDTAETYRSRFQEDEGILDKLLPYAILFGITRKWLAKMRTIYGEKYFETYQPAFMIGALSSTNFDTLIDNIDQISSNIATAISPASSGAGGGGMAGGGAGGGGGGGW